MSTLSLRTKSRYQKTRIALLFWCAFIGVGAICGATSMIVDPSGHLLGMDAMLPYFQVLPFSDVLFQNFLFSGFSLLIVNGLTNVVAFILLLRNKKLGIILGGIFGITLQLWIIIQFVIFPFNIMSTSYFIFGLLQAITGYMCYVFYTQEHFVFDASLYQVNSKDAKTLVVYFSRMGYTRKLAYECAQENKAAIVEIKTKESSEGTLGFWWCGRYGMHRWGMEIEDIEINVADYETVIIISPIWVFHIAAPVRQFLELYKGQINHVEYVLTHFTKKSYAYVVKELNTQLGKPCIHAKSYCVQFGKVKEHWHL